MNQLENLKDIKTITKIPDYSLYIFISLTFIILLILSFIIYNIYLHYHSRRDKKRFYINKLKNIDFKNPKKSAYKITKYGRKLVYDDRSEKIFEMLNREVERYKYKKNPPEISESLKQHLKLFIEVIDDKI